MKSRQFKFISICSLLFLLLVSDAWAARYVQCGGSGRQASCPVNDFCSAVIDGKLRYGVSIELTATNRLGVPAGTYCKIPSKYSVDTPGGPETNDDSGLPKPGVPRPNDAISAPGEPLPSKVSSSSRPLNAIPGRKGLTFVVRNTWAKGELHRSAVTTVGCKDSKGNECNPYEGDTSCAIKLPVLCFAPLPGQASPNASLGQWANGRVKATRPVRGDYFKTITEVNQACKNFGGHNWRAATFHESSKGWNWSAFGNVGSLNTKFWIHIADKPANCWSN